MNENPLYTISVHAGSNTNKYSGSITVPIYQSAVFAFPDAEQGAAIHEGSQPGYFYGRRGNPTQTELEKALSEIEGGEAAISFSSGMAAISETLFALLKPGDHIVASDSLYAMTNALLNEILSPAGVEVTYIDASDSSNFSSAIKKNTKIFYLETPANPTLKLVDIQLTVQIAKKKNIKVIVDNTFATPFNQRPVYMGVDVVIHSASKYIGGHGDLIAGALIASEEIVHTVRWNINKIFGGVIAPNIAWLVLRGIRTLALRMERHNSNALKIAKYLEEHPKVEKVYYPGLPSHPQYELAKKQMQGFGGIIAFEVRGLEEGRKLVNKLKLCTLAVSLGNVETLIEHPSSMTHAYITREERLAVGITDGLLRLSVGIERVEDIISDLEQGLNVI
jgi:methionine-gamma-lyase